MQVHPELAPEAAVASQSPSTKVWQIEVFSRRNAVQQVFVQFNMRCHPRTHILLRNVAPLTKQNCGGQHQAKSAL